jgi:hypothetical protein
MKYQKITNFTPPKIRIPPTKLKRGGKIRIDDSPYDEIHEGGIYTVDYVDYHPELRIFIECNEEPGDYYFYPEEITIIQGET